MQGEVVYLKDKFFLLRVIGNYAFMEYFSRNSYKKDVEL